MVSFKESLFMWIALRNENLIRSIFPFSFELWPSLFSLPFAPQWGHRRTEFPTVKGALSNCFLIISRACCETASGPGLGSHADVYCKAYWACSVICHCKGQGKWLYLSERIQFHPTITSPPCLQIFSQRKKGSSHMLCRISVFFTFFSQRIFELNTFFTDLNYKLWNAIQITVEICNLVEMWFLCVWVMHLWKIVERVILIPFTILIFSVFFRRNCHINMFVSFVKPTCNIHFKAVITLWTFNKPFTAQNKKINYIFLKSWASVNNRNAFISGMAEFHSEECWPGLHWAHQRRKVMHLFPVMLKIITQPSSSLSVLLLPVCAF